MLKVRKQLNRYTQRELEMVITALDFYGSQSFRPFKLEGPEINIHRSALAKSKIRLRRETDRAK